MTFDEILKTSLVFVHFVASAVALATILRADFLILSNYTQTLTARVCDQIHSAKLIVSVALWALWISGLAICAQGYLNDPAYVMNQKLWMKVAVVMTLTVNGWFLHRYAFGFIRLDARLSDAPARHRSVLSLLACLSSTSWLFASFLGIARALNHRNNLGDLVELYLVALSMALCVSMVVTRSLVRAHRKGASAQVLGLVRRPASSRVQDKQAA